MKVFHFRLDQALRWRAAQADIEKAKTARAALHVNTLQTELESRQKHLIVGVAGLNSGGVGRDFEAWAACSARIRREVREIEKQLRQAERDLGEQLDALVEANRKVQLLEKMKEADRAEWNMDLEREADAFSIEAFMVRYNKDHRRARSSGG